MEWRRLWVGALGLGRGQAQGDGILEAPRIARGERGGALAQALEEGVEPVTVGTGEVMQDVMGHRVLVPRMADTQADAVVAVAEMGMNRA